MVVEENDIFQDAGGAVSATGRRHVLRVETEDDFNRDVLKSETCGVFVPELDLEVVSGTLGGRFTTVEGLLTQIRDELDSSSFCSGDSSTAEDRENSSAFFTRFGDFLALKEPFTVILDDPMGNSYLQNIYAPDPDPFLEIVDYDRTDEQNEELGLSQMQTENYGEPEDLVGRN